MKDCDDEKLKKLEKLFALSEGEYIQYYMDENIAFIVETQMNYELEGKAILTNYGFDFITLKHIPRNSVNQIKNLIKETYSLFKIPYFTVNKLERKEEKYNETNEIDNVRKRSYILEIKTKDGKNLRFSIKDVKNFHFFEKFKNSSFLEKNNNMFYMYANTFRKFQDKKGIKSIWDEVYDIEKEFQRQKLKDNFYISDTINKDYNLVPTYPEKLIIPINMKIEEIIEASNFRTKNRFPVLCYFHHEHNTFMLRSSQTKSGLLQNRSELDEKLLECFRKDDLLQIYDARPYVNAFSMKVRCLIIKSSSKELGMKIQTIIKIAK